MKPKALVLQARGTNRDNDVIDALKLAGADPRGVPLNDLRAEKVDWREFQILVVAGGFSYADSLGAGKLLALDLTSYFDDEIKGFVDSGKPVIGICNGFQALVKSGILPGNSTNKPSATLTFNEKGHFECRWIYLSPMSQTCVWTRGMTELITCPVSHGEGNFQVSDPAILNELTSNDQIALTYARADGSSAHGEYPINPNGSVLDIAGVCNQKGNVIGLMPHPENHIYPWQNPHHTRCVDGYSGLNLFKNGVSYASDL